MFEFMVPLAAVQVFALWPLHRVYSNTPNLAMDAAALKDKVRVDSAGVLISVICGNVLFLLFSSGKPGWALAHSDGTDDSLPIGTASRDWLDECLTFARRWRLKLSAASGVI
jgi:hypothetical protein